MKKLSKFGVLLFFAAFAMAACEKGDPGPGCLIGNYATVTISNNSSDPYDYYLDDNFVTTIHPNSITNKLHIKTGNGHKLFVKQVSGYLISPTERTKTIDAVQCKDYDWQIP